VNFLRLPSKKPLAAIAREADNPGRRWNRSQSARDTSMNGREQRMWERMALAIGLALEHPPEGFDLCFGDSSNGGAAYSATIAIPRREGK